jgi:hypothetical protein
MLSLQRRELLLEGLLALGEKLGSEILVHAARRSLLELV